MGGIFLIQNDGQLVEMAEQAYDSESLLQQFLAQYPNLLAGDQMDTAAPRRWLLVSREMALASEEDGAGRWSVDHLFLDQDAVPTIVEVKRSTDTRIRREVVGQMLDYAANGVVYWPVELIRTRYEARCAAQGLDPAIGIADLTDNEGDPEAFWQQVDENFRAGKIRMVFVADVIPNELRRVVEFLNRQMNAAEVLAVEVRQYVGEGMRTLVPRIIGQTVEAQRKKTAQGSKEGQRWDEVFFMEELRTNQGEGAEAVVRKLMEWASENYPRFSWWKNNRYGIFYPCLDHKKQPYFPICIRTDGKVEILFQRLIPRPAFQEESKREELRLRLDRMDGLSLAPDAIVRRPNFSLSLLNDSHNYNLFIEALEWVRQEILNT